MSLVQKILGIDQQGASGPEKPVDVDDPLADVKARLSRPATPKRPAAKSSVANDPAATKAIADLLSPKNIARIIKMPFDTAFAVTGFSGWQLDADEEAVLSVCWSVACQYVVPAMNPAYLALVIASINTAMITSKKAWMFNQSKKQASEKAGSATSSL
jgi:hypothetical protein